MKRTNTATWLEKYNRWQIKVQKDGERRTFTSSIPGRNGQREANRKADARLEDGIQKRSRCDVLLDAFLENIKERTSETNYETEERRVRLYIKPVIKNMWVDSLNDAVLQNIIDSHAKHLAKKSLQNLRATMVAFVKYCRKNKLTTYIPDDVTIPKGACSKEHRILQPNDLKILFDEDTYIYYGKRVPEPYINAYRFQVLTGLRPGEIIGLMWSDISNGITVVVPYELRHTFVSIAKRLPEGLVKNIVGHSRDMDTFGVYGHAVAGDDDFTSEKLQKIVEKVLKK